MVSAVLLGAGASFGSKDAAPHTPPLGIHLFAKLEEAGGVAAKIPEEIKAVFRENFEEGMALYLEHTQGDVMRFQRELAHYLAKFIPGPDNTYGRMLKALDPRRVVYCSLNYDLMFEMAAEDIGINTIYHNELRPGHVRLLKPHGSANFWPDIPMGTFKDVSFRGSQVDIKGPVRAMSYEETIARCVHEDSLAPAIAMYAKGKRVKVCPEFVDRHLNDWKQLARDASRVFVVGVKVLPHDDHIWGELANSDARVTVFGVTDGDRDAFEEWKRDAGKPNAYFIQADFENSIGFIRSQI